MNLEEVMVLAPQEIRELLTIDECIVAVEHAFRLLGEGKTVPPAVLSMHTPTGGFHVKAGLLNLNRPYFAAKVNGNFPDNPKQFGLPTIQGVIVLCDAEKGCPLAVMDSRDITSLRTGAATAVAAKYLARRDSRVVTHLWLWKSRTHSTQGPFPRLPSAERTRIRPERRPDAQVCRGTFRAPRNPGNFSD